MASGFFGLLAQGASFSGRADVADFKKKQKRAKSGACAAERSRTGEKRPRNRLVKSADPELSSMRLSRLLVSMVTAALTTVTRAPDDDELDFFGFNAAACVLLALLLSSRGDD